MAIKQLFSYLLSINSSVLLIDFILSLYIENYVNTLCVILFPVHISK